VANLILYTTPVGGLFLILTILIVLSLFQLLISAARRERCPACLVAGLMFLGLLILIAAGVLSLIS